MEIWVKFCKSKNMGNVSMGKFLKTLPITVCQYMAKYSTYGLPTAELTHWKKNEPASQENCAIKLLKFGIFAPTDFTQNTIGKQSSYAPLYRSI